MWRALLNPRWSTLTVAGFGLATGALVYVGDGMKLSAPPSATDVRAGRRVSVDGEDTRPTKRGETAGVADIAPPMTSFAENFDERWRLCSSGLRTPAKEREMAALLEGLAFRDPHRAMMLAAAESNWRVRRGLQDAILRGWAAAVPEAAASWAAPLPEGERQLAFQAVFVGAAQRPDEAVRLARRLCTDDPQRAGDYGQFLITGLAEAGEYAAAAQFAATDTTTQGAAWLHTAFFQWAAHQPDQAARAVEAIADATVRRAAFHGMLSGWAMADPAALSSYAMNLTAGELRAEALNQALPQWVSRDPVGASEWLLRFDPIPDLDAGAAAMATNSKLVHDRPEIALGWAASIADPSLRANTLRLLAMEWAQRDREGVRRFIVSTPDLPESDRSALLDGLNPPPDA